MPNVVLSAINLLPIYIDVKGRRLLGDLSTGASHDSFQFVRGDTYKGVLYALYPTGLQNPPWFQFNTTNFELAVTDGAATAYCTASGWEAQGVSNQNPHMTFNLELQSTALDAVLAKAGGSMSAWIEVHISGLNAIEGSAFPQDQYIIKEQVTIVVSGLNPLPVG